MRKSLFTIIFIFMGIIASAQIDNYSVSDGIIVWQKIIEKSISIGEAAEALAQSGDFYDIIINDEKQTIVCKSFPKRIDFKSMGYNRMNIPMYIRDCDMEYHATIQFKKGRYRVSVDNIAFIQRATDYLSEKGERTSIEAYAIGKNGINDIFKGVASVLINGHLESVFQFETKGYLNDEW